MRAARRKVSNPKRHYRTREFVLEDYYDHMFQILKGTIGLNNTVYPPSVEMFQILKGTIGLCPLVEF